MNNFPRITESEWEVMNVIWARSKATAHEVIEALAQTENTWKPATVKSLISRLVKKNVLGYTQEGKLYCYYPLLSKEECLRSESSSFLQRLYGGTLKPMLVHFLSQENISNREIEELQNILEKRKE
ncbi:BlaI/MecI/CopY family transcriptional regulator [Paenibacillus arenosi]|uniref:BlaI/MecI/CopY family transcriptional regulator n=1 Tax=Paenibacillus arenosi TaxID=2774142 RepID=A0ABR9AWH2_9BACL|nr:BlaI/MecI/CopY family transcriptional regulator [Paenibacillus arenosi]MBD8498450.1 BlaI/MecI/CopY family transcriptional regulator [Paenibacillus arenosi]